MKIIATNRKTGRKIVAIKKDSPKKTYKLRPHVTPKRAKYTA